MKKILKPKRPTFNQCTSWIPEVAYQRLTNSTVFQVSGIEIQKLETHPNNVLCKVQLRLQNTGETNFKRALVTALTISLTEEQKPNINPNINHENNSQTT
jgi:hypothetical protein